MIEVFKTSVSQAKDAQLILEWIQHRFPEVDASFDLEDCDRILRIASARVSQIDAIPEMLKALGFEAEVLPDEYAEAIINHSCCSFGLRNWFTSGLKIKKNKPKLPLDYGITKENSPLLVV